MAVLAFAISASLSVVGAQILDGGSEFDRCKTIPDDHMRLACFKALLSNTENPGTSAQAPSSSPSYDWPLIRTPHPKGGPDALSITRTADTAKSDPDLAGLIVRCQDRPGLEILLALVRPLPPRRKRQVELSLGAARPILTAEVSPAGTALILPIEPNAISAQRELTVEIDDPDGRIRGVIPLDGFGPALAKLSASCPLSRP
jgi:hypothetical protein